MSQDSVHILSTLRRLISEGRYAPGERMAEIPVAAQLGVSRTPVRLAFRTLEQEGLLEKAGARGYVVRRFSEQDVMGGLEVRGVLEGLAARRLGEQGLPQATRQLLRDCVEQGARLLAAGELSPAAIAGWSEINARFHHAIIDASESRAIADAIARNDHLPFASSDSIIIDTSRLAQEYEKLRVAQLQHSLVLDALLAGEAARAEMLMREHAYIGLRYGRLLGLHTPV
ncbi:GntR family transcriptional regulator [Thiomonas sp. FB-6]|uniref:GntR family transcriptional regulator n=1 Tax=Thiomonas sp. FB-6 TaxID=1158291 RepID=UPI0003745272|nr:GntR family transcriptional regulator [Thiomonas sp. FB-6]